MLSLYRRRAYKGAPERLLAKATKYLDADGKVCDLNMDVLNSKIDELAERDKRTIRDLSVGSARAITLIRGSISFT